MGRSPVVGAAFGLFCVWWTLSLLAYLATGRVWSGEEWIASSAQAWVGVATGCLVGLGATAAIVFAARQWRIARLTGDNVRGVTCSIGRLPINFDRPDEAEDMPDKASLRLPPEEYDPKRKIDRDWMDKWFDQYEQHHPEHAALMRAVARVLNSKPDLPAACRKLAAGTKAYQYGYDQHSHGDHTLLEHSWSCASVGIWLTKNGFEYDGVEFKDRYKKAVGFIGKKDDSYVFESWDPLIGLICFAHDIGKIETFRVNQDGKVEVIEPAHDSVGARMLTRMDEFWALPFEDRMTLTLAIGHYHKPNEMPLRRDADSQNKAVALSDRTMAMLNLVILSDEEAGAIENKKSQEEGKDKPKEIVEKEYRANLWEAFKDLLNESQRVHTEPSKFRIGQKNTVADGIIITLKEGDLRKELLDKMQLRKSGKESLTATGTAQITEDLLEVLDQRGCLIKSYAGVQVDAKQAIWKVEFMGKDKNRVGDVIATWPYAIIINPEEHFPRLASGPDAQSLPRVTAIADTASMMEEKKPRADAPKSAFTEAPLQDANGGYILAEGTKDKSKRKKPAEAHEGKPLTAAATPSGNMTNAEGGQEVNEGPRGAPRRADSVEGDHTRGLTEPAASHKVPTAAEPKSTVGTETADAASHTVLAGIMDELDPVKTEAPRVTHPTEVNEVQSATLGAKRAREEGTPQTSMDKVARVQTLLKSKIAAEGGKREALDDATKRSAESNGDVPEDVIELARSLRGPLAKIKTASASQKLAAEEFKDGRQAYSLEALGAVVPEMKAQLAADADLLRRLMEAAKFGKNVPVCVVYRAASGVTLVVVNEAEVANALRRKKG